MSGTTGLAVALSATAGLAGAVQAAVMGELGGRVGTGPAVAASAVVSIAVALPALAFVAGGYAGLLDVARQPPWLWTGGVLSVYIILAITVGAPRIGVSATIGLVIAGNLVMAAVVDQLGLFGLDRVPISATRALGMVLLGVGAALTLARA